MPIHVQSVHPYFFDQGFNTKFATHEPEFRNELEYVTERYFQDLVNPLGKETQLSFFKSQDNYPRPDRVVINTYKKVEVVEVFNPL
jgi:hypothetical protein